MAIMNALPSSKKAWVFGFDLLIDLLSDGLDYGVYISYSQLLFEPPSDLLDIELQKQQLPMTPLRKDELGILVDP